MQRINLTYNITLITVLATFVIWLTTSVDYTLYNGIITAKERVLEVLLLPSLVLILLSLLIKRNIKFTIIDLLTILFLCWIFINNIFIQKTTYITTDLLVYTIAIWTIIYVLIRSTINKKLTVISLAIVLILSSSYQSFIGLKQLYGYKSSLHNIFQITGTFFNPGPYAGYVALSIPILIALVLYFEKLNISKTRYKWMFKLFKIIVWCLLFINLIILPPTQSRAAWIATFMGVTYIFVVKYNLLSKLKSQIFQKRVLILLSVLLVTLAISGYSLFKYKEASANGRTLIWKVTSQLIAQKPVSGYGMGAFDALYMNQQANHFQLNDTNIKEQMVAGTPEAPFNEFFNIWLSYGLIAVLIIIFVIFIILFRTKTNPENKTAIDKAEYYILTGLKGTLVTFITFSLFSYPLMLAPFTLIIIMIIATLGKYSKPIKVFKHRFILPTAVMILGIYATIHYLPQRKEHYKHLKEWNKTNNFYQMQNYDIAVEAYEEIYSTFKHNGEFLQLYGKALNIKGDYKESNRILTEAKKYCNNQIIENTLGDNYKALGKVSKAETAYTKSMNMIPSMLYPKYLLAKLYEENDMKEKAKNMAQIIINHPLKVESTATREINSYVKKILEN